MLLHNREEELAAEKEEMKLKAYVEITEEENKEKQVDNVSVKKSDK